MDACGLHAGGAVRPVVLVFGTRPEAIKLGPVAAALRGRGVSPVLLCTGQHTSLLAGTPAETDLRDAYSLGMASDGNVERWVGEATDRLRAQFPPDALVVVQGDTMSAYAGALAASNANLPLAHVEAGLRTGHLDEPWPEEGFRVAIGQLAQLHFAPTERAAENLRRERVSGEIVVTGNPVVSALARYASVEPRPPVRQILVTMHRREWLGLGREHVVQTVRAVMQGARAHPGIRFVWPVHPALRSVLGRQPDFTPRNLRFIAPLPYSDAVFHLSRSMGVLTDSGGLAEEAATLGVPCAVTRNVTDRPESVDIGLAKLFPPNPTGIRSGIRWILAQPPTRHPSSCFGTPESAAHIACSIVFTLKS